VRAGVSRSDDRGLFRFQGLTLASYTIFARPQADAVNVLPALKVVGVDSNTRDLVLIVPRTAMITGRVLWRGEPVQGARVAASDLQLPYEFAHAMSHKDGSFSLSVAQGLVMSVQARIGQGSEAFSNGTSLPLGTTWGPATVAAGGSVDLSLP
jgi:hypothetical protein